MSEEMSPPSQPCDIVWESYVDETSGETYYYNVLTGQSVWTLEETQTEDPRLDVWETYADENGDEYYYNCITGETSWDLPNETNDVMKKVNECPGKNDTKIVTIEKVALLPEEKEHLLSMKKWKKGLLSVRAVCKAREECRRARGERCSQCNERLRYESVECHNKLCRRRACKKCASFVMQGSYATNHKIEHWICSVCDEEMIDCDEEDYDREEKVEDINMTGPEASARAARTSLEASSDAVRCRDSTLKLIRRIREAKVDNGKDWIAHYAAVAAVGRVNLRGWYETLTTTTTITSTSVSPKKKRTTTKRRWRELKTSQAELTRIIRNIDEHFVHHILHKSSNEIREMRKSKNYNNVREETDSSETKWSQDCSLLQLERWIEQHDEHVFHNTSDPTLWSRRRESELESLSNDMIVSEVVSVLHENDGKGRGRYALFECARCVWKEWYEDISSNITTNHVRRYIRKLAAADDGDDDDNGKETNKIDTPENILCLFRKLGLYKITMKHVQKEFYQKMSIREVFRWLRETRQRSDQLSETQRSVHKLGVYVSSPPISLYLSIYLELNHFQRRRVKCELTFSNNSDTNTWRNSCAFMKRYEEWSYTLRCMLEELPQSSIVSRFHRFEQNEYTMDTNDCVSRE